MSGNGKPNGDDQSDEFSAIFPGIDFDPSIFTDIYVSYEQVVGTLMWASMQSKLRLYAVENTLDINSLERNFKACGVPMDWTPPHQLRADISFFWPSEYTALSLDGDEAYCSLYHDPDEPCEHEPGAAEIFTELEVKYHLPYGFVQQIDSDAGIEAVARRIRTVFADVVDHDNLVTVEVGAIFGGAELSLSAIHARHYWVLDDELHNLPQLAAVVLSICDEVVRVLQRFTQEFPHETEDSEL